jgi:hypothetical protein
LFVSQGRLVFMEENQAVVYWGVRSRTAAVDPVVFQTADPEEGDWLAESKCSRFLTAMLCWQAVGGGLPYIGYSNPIDFAAARRLARNWPRVGHLGGLSAYVRAGQVMCVFDERAFCLLHIGARSHRDFQALVKELGVPVHEA